MWVFGTDKGREGEIIEKVYLDERTEHTYMPMVHTDGKTMYTTMVPIIQHHPEQWKVCIRSLNKNEVGEYDTAVYYIMQEVYDKCNVGDLFSYDEERGDTNTESVEKFKEK